MWRELRRKLPSESLVYLGDGKNCPYGGRRREDIERFAFDAVGRLVDEGVKMVVVGCNTATTAAVAALREHWKDMPIVGLEPAVKPACLTSRTRRIAVLATKHSLESDMFLKTAMRYAEGVDVVKVVGEGFVEIVEEDREESVGAFDAVRHVVEPLVDSGIDKIVLGCTHYPFLKPHIREVIGHRDIEIIDSGEAVARRVKWLLERYEIAAVEGNVAECRFLSFADEEYRRRLENKASKIMARGDAL